MSEKITGRENPGKINYKRHFCILEYPRSGGNWVLKLLSEYLNIPYRDIDKNPKSFIEKLNWKIFKIPNRAIFNQTRVKNPFSYLIKTHRFYQHEYKKIVYCIRDGRDVLASYYYFEKDFKRKAMLRKPEFDFNPQLPDTSQFERYLKYRFETKFPIFNWAEHIRKALKLNDVIFIKYEDLNNDTYNAFANLLGNLEIKVDMEKVKKVCGHQSFDLEKKRIEKNNEKMGLHLRSGKIGEWVKIFNDASLKYFNEKAKDIMIELGYYQINPKNVKN